MPKVIGYVVYCGICGHGYDESDPAVRWLNIDREWSCVDEAACFTRRAESHQCPQCPGCNELYHICPACGEQVYH